MQVVKTTIFLLAIFYNDLGLSDDKKDSGKNGNDAYTAIMSTKFDFGDTNINGEMKAPEGFFLQGKQSQSLSQMVRLRSSFKRELRNSKSGIKSLTR